MDSFSRHMLYILYNEKNNQTYNGYTIDFKTRLRKHNCQLVGGARFTTRLVKSKNVEWKPLALIHVRNPEFDLKRALSVEWSIKYPTNRRPRPANFNNPIGRIRGLSLVLENPKFADLTFYIHVFSQDTFDILNLSKENCCIIKNDSL